VIPVEVVPIKLGGDNRHLAQDGLGREVTGAKSNCCAGFALRDHMSRERSLPVHETLFDPADRRGGLGRW
jgi:hypothetical protein